MDLQGAAQPLLCCPVCGPRGEQCGPPDHVMCFCIQGSWGRKERSGRSAPRVGALRVLKGTQEVQVSQGTRGLRDPLASVETPASRSQMGRKVRPRPLRHSCGDGVVSWLPSLFPIKPLDAFNRRSTGLLSFTLVLLTGEELASGGLDDTGQCSNKITTLFLSMFNS